MFWSIDKWGVLNQVREVAVEIKRLVYRHSVHTKHKIVLNTLLLRGWWLLCRSLLSGSWFLVHVEVDAVVFAATICAAKWVIVLTAVRRFVRVVAVVNDFFFLKIAISLEIRFVVRVYSSCGCDWTIRNSNKRIMLGINKSAADTIIIERELTCLIPFSSTVVTCSNVILPQLLY